MMIGKWIVPAVLAVSLTMSSVATGAYAGTSTPPSSSDKTTRNVVLGAVLLGLLIWGLRGDSLNGSSGLGSVSKNAGDPLGAPSKGKLLQKF